MQRLKWVAMLGIATLIGWALSQPPVPVSSSPLGQATATPTPRISSLGGVPITCVDNSAVLAGTCALSTSSSGGGSVSTAPTQIPGIYTTVVVANATVALTPVTTPQVAAKTNRLYLICTNDSDSGTVYLSPAGTAALNAGIRLNPGGASYEMSERLGNLSLGGVWAASATAGSTLTCIEGSR